MTWRPDKNFSYYTDVLYILSAETDIKDDEFKPLHGVKFGVGAGIASFNFYTDVRWRATNSLLGKHTYSEQNRHERSWQFGFLFPL